MNREIKFRAWDEEIKHMYYPPNEHIGMDMNGYCLNLQNGVKLIPLLWTGLKDKNGKEIWDGDIVKGYWRDKPNIVRFENGSFCIGYHLTVDDIEARESEVIGNIYENPELMGDK